jgi:hypothetical protein
MPKSFLMLVLLIIVVVYLEHQIAIRAQAAETILTGPQRSGGGEVVTNINSPASPTGIC